MPIKFLRVYSLTAVVGFAVATGCMPGKGGPNAILDAGEAQRGETGPGTTSDGGKGSAASAALVGTPAAQLLLLLIDTLEKPVDTIVRGTSQAEYTVVYTALGLAGARMDLSIALPCSGDGALTVSAETCLSDFGSTPSLAGFDGCFVSGCSDPVHWFIDTYLVKRPMRHLDERETITYELRSDVLPHGIVTYQPSPATHWEFDSDGNTIHSSVILAANLMVALQDGENIDLSYSGSATGTKVNEYSYTMRLELPSLIQSGELLTVAIENGSMTPRSGVLMIGSTTIAALSDDGVTWY